MLRKTGCQSEFLMPGESSAAGSPGSSARPRAGADARQTKMTVSVKRHLRPMISAPGNLSELHREIRFGPVVNDAPGQFRGRPYFTVVIENSHRATVQAGERITPLRLPRR